MIIQGDCLEKMREMQDNNTDFIVTDPPYGLKFMSKQWDHGIPGIEYWKEALRICKPGSMLAAFGGTRTFHRLACALEDAGWEIRDCMMWLYGQGFPKSHNNFGLEGYGTALKPAWEPIIICMKPLDGTYSQNVEKWGLGGINIDACRIPSDLKSCKRNAGSEFGQSSGWNEHKNTDSFYDASKGRWPANLILDEEAAEMLDEQSGVLKSGSMILKNHVTKRNIFNKGFKSGNSCDIVKSSGGASRFFYCAKASSKERNAGLGGMELKKPAITMGLKIDKTVISGERTVNHRSNNHPTVKTLSLMRYILKLLAPPGNPIVLDPFAGSGSTLCAAKQLGIRHIGIELEKDYCDIAQKRLDHTQEFEEK